MAAPPTYSDPTEQPGYGYHQPSEDKKDPGCEMQPSVYVPPPYEKPQQSCGPPPPSYEQPQQGYGLPLQGFVQQPIPTSGFGNSTTVVTTQPAVREQPTLLTTQDSDPQPPGYVVVLAWLVCFICNLPFGLAAVFLAIQATDLNTVGLKDKAKSLARASLALSISGAVFAVIIYVVLFTVVF